MSLPPAAPVIVNELFETVAALADTGVEVLLVEQLVDQAMAVAQPVLVFDHGRVVTESGTAGSTDLDTVWDVYLGRHTTSRRCTN